MKKKILKYLALLVLWALIISQALAVLIGALKNKFQINKVAYFSAYKAKEFLPLFLVLFIGGFLYFIVTMYKKGDFKQVLKHSGGEYSHFLTNEEVKKSKDFYVMDYKKISKFDSGIILQTKEKGKKMQIIMTKPNHTLLIGTTGSGKNVGYLDSNIYFLSKTKEKPSFVVSDPKGENFFKHSSYLKESGYDIKLINLRDPYISSRWNPFDIVIKHIEEINKIKEFKDEDYAIGKKILKDEEKVRIQELQDNIYQDTKDIIYTMFPLQKSSDMTWQEGARNLILAFTMAIIEDIQNKRFDSLNERCLIPYNIFYNISRYAVDSCAVLKSYINKRDKLSKVPSLAGSVLASIDSDKTLASYLSTVQGMIQSLSDTGILALTSENEINLREIDEKPIAVFVIVPDEKKERHSFATLLVSQIYKSLVYKAQDNFNKNLTKDRFLKRHTYFLLDEFGNLPKFENLEAMITVARSRKIFFELVVQSFEQLEAVYGSKVAKIVRGNCNLKVFLGTTEKATQDEFSSLCGKRLVENLSVSSSDKSQSQSTSAKEVPLVTQQELGRLNSGDNIGNAISLCFGHYPLKTKFIPSYRSNIMKFSKNEINLNRKPDLFVEKEYLFDIESIVKTQKTEKDTKFQENQEEKNKENEYEEYQKFINNISKQEKTQKKDKHKYFNDVELLRYKDLINELSKYIEEKDIEILNDFIQENIDIKSLKRVLNYMKKSEIENTKALSIITKIIDLINNAELEM